MFRKLAQLAITALVLTGCTSAESGYQPTLEFEARTISGEEFAGSSIAGQDTLIWFWTPWCAICARESQDIVALKAKYPEVNFIGIAGYGTAEEMTDFTRRTGTEEILHLNDATGELWTGFEVPIQPSAVTIKADGTAILKVGPSSKAELEQMLEALVND